MLQKPNHFLLATLLFLSSCAVTLPGSSSGTSGTTGSVPIYQGMTVSGLANSSNLQSPKNQNEINQENPFDLPNNEKLESKIESDLADLMLEESLDYYARPSETVRITINILNPQSYVILSFNLNGRRYQSFEFREGSTSTRLLMDVTLQNLPGVQSLTIDEIKYIVDSEGDNQIRDVVMFGDQTVEVGVGYSQLPTVNMVSQSVLPTTVTYSIVVSDTLNILSTQETAIYFYFFDGETLQKEELIVGNNELVFNKLTSKTLYQYAIVSALNPLDGEGPVLTYYDVEAFYSSNFIQLSVNATKESINYEVNIVNGLESGDVTRVELEKNREILTMQEETSGSFDGLLSNNDYALNVYYEYAHEGETEVLTEVYSLTTKTLSKSTPTFSFTDVVAGKEDVTFEYEVTDLDEVGSLSKIELLKGEEIVETLIEFEDTSFANLLSNNDYQLKATYTYDLNDGVGEQTIVVTNQTKTLPKEAPEFSFSNLVPSKESIAFDYVVTDLDQVGSLIKIELIKGDSIIETFTSFDNLFLEGLLSNNQYLLKAYYEVDLNDGLGLQTLVFNQEFTTLSKSTPTFSFTDVVAGKEDVTFEYEVTDLDEVGSLSKIELLKGEEVVETLIEFEDTSFANLLSNNDYQLKATYTYDLNDGVGNRILNVNINYTTLSKIEGEVSFTNFVVSENSASFTVLENDVDETLSISKLILLKNGNVVSEINFTNTYEFEFINLISLNEYQLKAEYLLDLNDGNLQAFRFKIKNFYTNPTPISVSSVTILNQNGISVDDEILIRVGFNNQSQVNVSGIYINNILYETLSSNPNFLILTIENPNSGGEFDFDMTSIIATFGLIEFDLDLIETYVLTLTVYSKIEIQDLFNTKNNYDVTNQTLFYITLINENGYQIENVEIHFNQRTGFLPESYSLTILSNDLISFKWSSDYNASLWYGSMNNILIKSISYIKDGSEIINQTLDYSKSFYGLYSYTRPISSVDDLKNIEPSYIYYLTQDLDFTGVQSWTPIEHFNISLDGKGFKIKNYSLSSPITRYLSGALYNINFENINLFAGENYSQFGLFGESLNNAIILNCTFDIDIISNKAHNGIGLLAGGANGSILIGNSIHGSIFTTFINQNNINDVGGVVGYSSRNEYSNNTIDISIDTGYKFNQSIGGMVGVSGNDKVVNNNLNINILVNNERLTSTDSIGLFSGRSGNSTIESNLIIGTINYTGFSNYIWSAGLVGISSNDQVKNNYVQIEGKIKNLNTNSNYATFGSLIGGATLIDDYIGSNVVNTNVEITSNISTSTFFVGAVLSGSSNQFNQTKIIENSKIIQNFEGVLTERFVDLNSEIKISTNYENLFRIILNFDPKIWNLISIDLENNLFPALNSYSSLKIFNIESMINNLSELSTWYDLYLVKLNLDSLTDNEYTQISNLNKLYDLEISIGLTYKTLNETKIYSSNPTFHENFGTSVSIHGNYLVVGGNPSLNNNLIGQIYVFNLDDPNYLRIINSPDTSLNNGFGSAVSLFEDFIVVGAPRIDDKGENSGGIYVFKISDESYQRKIVASDGLTGDSFGTAVSVKNNYLIVGSAGNDDKGNNSGSAYVYMLNDLNYERLILAFDGSANDRFGSSVSLDGDYMVVGATGDYDNGIKTGSAYIYKISDLDYVRKLLPSDGTNEARFGNSVSIYGEYIAVGSWLNDNYIGSVYLYKISDETFEVKLSPLEGDYDLFGSSVSIHANYLLVGSYGRGETGAIYLYELDNLMNQYPIFSTDKSIRNDVNLDYFGSSISMYGNTIVVGAFGDDDNEILNSGSVYIFTK